MRVLGNTVTIFPMLSIFTKLIYSFCLIARLGIKSVVHPSLRNLLGVTSLLSGIDSFLRGGEGNGLETHFFFFILLVTLCLAALKIFFLLFLKLH